MFKDAVDTICDINRKEEDDDRRIEQKNAVCSVTRQLNICSFGQWERNMWIFFARKYTRLFESGAAGGDTLPLNSSL